MAKNFKRLLPDEYVPSIHDYDFDAAREKGKRLILFDIDNTMVPHDAPADQRVKDLVKALKQKGFVFCGISNNRRPRVQSFCDTVGVPYVVRAGKPGKRGYMEALRKCGARPEEALFFGDQIFTDIWGANRAGIDSVLVKPVDFKTDKIQIRLKRLLEKPLIRSFFREKGLAIYDYFH